MKTEAIRRSTLWLRCFIRHGSIELHEWCFVIVPVWKCFVFWELPVSCVPKSKSDTGWYACPQAKELLPCSRLHSLLPICSHPIVTTVFLCSMLSVVIRPPLSASSEWWKAAIKLAFPSKGTSRRHQETEQTFSAHNTFKTKVPYTYPHLPVTHIWAVSLQHGEISDWRQPEFL